MCPEMTTRDWKMRIQDILVCIGKIQQYTEGMSFEEFKGNDKTIDAVIRNFEIIGEAASHIPERVQEKYPDLGWLEMRGMRNIMIHEYFGVSLPILWHTVVHDLGPLAVSLKRILEDKS